MHNLYTDMKKKIKKLTCRYQSHKRRQSLSTGIAATPAMVLGSVDEIYIPVTQDSHWRQASRLCIGVHAFNDQHLVVDIVHTFIRLPCGLVCTVLISNYTYKIHGWF